MFNRNELSIYRKNVLSCPQGINYSMNNPRRKRSGYRGIVSIRRKRRGIYPKEIKKNDN